MLIKTCISCLDDFPNTTDFYYSKGGKRLRSECKKCWNKMMKKQYARRWFLVKKINDNNRKLRQNRRNNRVNNISEQTPPKEV